MATLLVCDGLPEANPDGTVSCPGEWTAVEYVPPFDPSQLDPAELGMAMGLGFFIVLVPMGIAWGARQLVSTVNLGR